MAQLIRLASRLNSTRRIPSFLESQVSPLQACFMSSTAATAAATLPTSVAGEAWRKDYNPDLEDQTFVHDKHTIGFAEYGSRTGVPAFLFHGAPGSRYDGLVYHESAKKLDVRIICPDRLGYGLSTFMSDRTLVDYASGISA